MEIKHTQRGFGYYEFEDSYGAKCSLQESSSAMKPKVWLGPDSANPLIMASDAPKHGIFPPPHVGWVSFPIPSEVLLTTRMHLDQEQARELIKRLQVFVDTGGL